MFQADDVVPREVCVLEWTTLCLRGLIECLISMTI